MFDSRWANSRKENRPRFVLYGFSPENLALWTSPGGLPPGVDGFARTMDGSEILRAVDSVIA